MYWKPKRYRNNKGGLLARNFVDRLERGLLIDRKRVHTDGKSRYKIAAPKALTKLVRKP